LRRLNDVITYVAQQPLIGRERPEIPASHYFVD
jgi:hypothetical protein